MINLERATENTLKKILHKQVCLPSEYEKIFKEESNFLYNENINSAIKENIEEKVHEVYELQEATERIVLNSQELISSSNNIIKDTNLENLKNEMLIMLDKINYLKNEIYNDELTNLKNRKWLYHIFLKENKTNSSGLFIFLDLNKFKYINDTYGHNVGDKTLIYFANFIKAELLKYFEKNEFEFIRYSGDEFIIIFNNIINSKQITNEIRIKKLLFNIRKDLKQKKFKWKSQKDKNTFNIDFAYGVKPFYENEEFDSILIEADLNMYEMKKNERK